MRADHRRQLRGLLGLIDGDVHAELVVLAESVDQAAKRGDDAARRALLEEYENGLRRVGRRVVAQGDRNSS